MKKTVLMLIVLLSGCDTGGASTTDVRQAAIDEARDKLGLAANVPVEARVWTGTEYDGEPSVCGTVSSADSQMPPQRFLARLEPLEWLVFENAHSPMRGDQNKFPSWQKYCSSVPVGTGVASADDNACGTRLDTNKNGMIEETEYLSFKFAFDDWDTNDDRSVSADEFRRCWGSVGNAEGVTGGLALFDQDGDGTLSQEEFFAGDRFAEFARLTG